MTESTVQSQRKASMLATALGLPLQLSPYLDGPGGAFRVARSLAECQCQDLPGYLYCCFLRLFAKLWWYCAKRAMYIDVLLHSFK